MANRGAVAMKVVAADNASTYKGSRFSDVRAQLLSDPYTVLPRPQVSIWSMFKAFKNILMQDCITLVDREADIVPPMQKLLHGAGICFFGRWTITEETSYTGCLRSGSDYLIVVRCSTLLSHTDQGARRGFGFAGKIFPTLDPNELVKTANFVCIDNLGGTFARYKDVALANEPVLGANLGLLAYPLAIINGLYCFRRAVTTPMYRPLYALTETGLRPGEAAKGPKWLQITAEEGIVNSDAIDFRDELRLCNCKDARLRFNISVADERAPSGERLLRRIGVIELTEDVCSFSGDHRIRFRHIPSRGPAPA
jgi:hypothetical protein